MDSPGGSKESMYFYELRGLKLKLHSFPLWAAWAILAKSRTADEGCETLFFPAIATENGTFDIEHGDIPLLLLMVQKSG